MNAFQQNIHDVKETAVHTTSAMDATERMDNMDEDEEIDCEIKVDPERLDQMAYPATKCLDTPLSLL